MRPKIVLFALLGLLAAGCPTGANNGAGLTGGAASSSGKVSPTTLGGLTSSTSTANPNTDAQCQIFANSPSDLAACVGCKTTLCPCTTLDPTKPGGCGATDILSCTVDTTQLVACVHNNVVAIGGTCIGLKCANNQVADFNACVCRDALPSVSVGPAPGQEDTTTPYLQPGFFVSERFCAPAATNSATAPSNVDACLMDGAGHTNANSADAGLAGVPPAYAQQSPNNVFSDVGYLRWDLGLDASQYSPALPLLFQQPFMGSWATFPVTLSMYYQLKPNTTPTMSGVGAGAQIKVNVNDCAEHFSGYQNASGAALNATFSLSSSSDCLARTGNTPGARAPSAVVAVPNSGGSSGTAVAANISINGTAANKNVLGYNTQANPAAFGVVQGATGSQVVGTGTSGIGFGLAKEISTGIDSVGSSVRSTGTAMLSNLGYYKYTWGPFSVKRPSTTAVVASGTVSGLISVNTNLGYNPLSAVESTALSQNSAAGTLQTRDCTVAANPSSCIISTVYRSPGGGILSQSFGPTFANTKYASTVMALPSGVTAVSTPKIIEDTSQMDVTTGQIHTPARLRTFVRAADGNIYMSRYDGGRWRSWLSLGRPWMADPATAGSLVTSGGGANALSPPYLPIYGNQSNLAVGATSGQTLVTNAYGPAVSGTSNQGNGISIIGEPVVVSSMSKNTVYANLGGTSAGAPLDISTIGIVNAAACAVGNPGPCQLQITFGGTVPEDPTPLFPAIGGSVYLSGFALTGPSGTSLNTVAGGAPVPLSIANVVAPNCSSFGLTGPCPIFNAPGYVVLNIPSGFSLTVGSGLTSSAKITQYPDNLANWGMIGIFVRVSQLQSTDGKLGRWHNSVWYTMAKSQNTNIVNGAALDFDDPGHWTNWMLVQEGPNDQSFRIQGNPVVVLQATPPAAKNLADTSHFYIFGTSSFNGTGGYDPTLTVRKVMLHPPVGPTGDVSDPTGADCNVFPTGPSCPFIALGAGGASSAVHINSNETMHTNWYNYGLDTLRTSIDVSSLPTAHWPPAGLGQGTGSATAYPYPANLGGLGIPWKPVSAAPVTANNGVLGDWAYATVSNQTNSIRLFAMDHVSAENPCYDLEIHDANGIYTPLFLASTVLVAPCMYKKQMIWEEYGLENSYPPARIIGGAHDASGIDFGCHGIYTGAPSIGPTAAANLSPPQLTNNPYAMNFTGSLHAINIHGAGANPGAVDSIGTSMAATTPTTGSAGHMLVFGRAICPDKGRCDNVNPTVAYMAVNHETECTPVLFGGAFVFNDSTKYDATEGNTSNPVPQSNMYYAGEIYSWKKQNNVAAGQEASVQIPRTTITPFNATADVIPIFSNALKNLNNDASLFFFTRDSSGNIAHGYWEGMTSQGSGSDPGGQMTGSRDFTIFSSGAFTN